MHAPLYDFVTYPLKRLRRTVVEVAALEPGARVLDVATGTGEQALAFAASAGEVIGIDLSDAMLRIAARKLRPSHVTFRNADATALPFDAARFDASCISFGLHEMPPRIREQTMREMVRVTRPGGRIVIIDYALPQNRLASQIIFQLVKLYERDNYAEFVHSDLRALLERCGIRLEIDRPVLRGAARVVVGRS